MAVKSNFRRWTREETIIVFNLYCQIPFKESNKSHPDVQRFAKLVNRTPSAVNMKIGNFGSFDPELKKRGITGLRNASRLDKQIWDEFHNDWQTLIEESERLIAERVKTLDDTPSVDLAVESEELPETLGGERLAVRRVREISHFSEKRYYLHMIVSAALLESTSKHCSLQVISSPGQNQTAPKN